MKKIHLLPILLVALGLTFPSKSFPGVKTILDLTEETAPTSDDLLELWEVTSGKSRKVQIGNLGKGLTGFGAVTGTGDFIFDDGVGDSPATTWRDQDNNYGQIYKADAGKFYIYNNEASIVFLASGDTDDFVKIGTLNDIPYFLTEGATGLQFRADGSSIDLMPSGDDDDYFSFTTVADVPTLGVAGGSAMTITPAVTFTAAPHLPADSVNTLTEIAAALKSGSDAKLITGTAGTNNYCAIWNADGDLVDGPGVPATTTLGNIASTAIPESLISDAANADDLGTEAKFWKKLYLSTEISFEGATDNEHQTTLTVTDPTGDHTITIPASDQTVGVATSAGSDAIDAIGEIKSTLRSGSDTTLITGTSGTNTYCAIWNNDGDLVDGPGVPYVVGGTDVAIADGGTGAGTASGAASALGVGTEDTPSFTGLTLANGGVITFTDEASDTITHTNDTGIAIVSGSGTVTVEGVIFTGDAISSVTTISGTGTFTSGGLTIDHGLPKIELNDNTADHMADAFIEANADSDDDSVMTMGVDDSVGDDQTYITLDGVNEKILFSKFLDTFEFGHATDTTIARSGAGDITIEGNAVYRAGGTDVPDGDVADDISLINITQIGTRPITNLTATNWRMFYSADGSVPVELVLGADGTFLESNGASAAPAFRVLAAGDIPDISGTYLVNTGDTCTGNFILDNTGESVNSPSISLKGDAGGVEEEADIHLVQGVDPYIRISVDDDNSDPVLTAVLDIHNQVIAFSTDNQTDIGATGDNRPKDLYLAGAVQEGAWNATAIDISSYTNLAVTANELTLTDDTLGLADHDTARTALGLAIGSDVQAYNDDLDALAVPTAWRMFYSDAADPFIQEITLGADGTFLESNGASAAPSFRVLAAADIPSIHSSQEVDSPTKSFIINAATTADDFLLWRTNVDITITDIYGVLQSGTNVVGGLDECDSAGANPVAVDADITFDGGLDQDDGGLTNGGIDAGDWIKWHTTSVSSPGYLTVTINYTID